MKSLSNEFSELTIFKILKKDFKAEKWFIIAKTCYGGVDIVMEIPPSL